jgi:hypothetical protein
MGERSTSSWEAKASPSDCWLRVLIERMTNAPVSQIAPMMSTQQNLYRIPTVSTTVATRCLYLVAKII